MGLYICIYIHACGPPPVPHMAVRTVASLTHHWPPPTPTTSGSCSGPTHTGLSHSFSFSLSLSYTRSPPPPPPRFPLVAPVAEELRTYHSVATIPPFPPVLSGKPIVGGRGVGEGGGEGVSIYRCLSVCLSPCQVPQFCRSAVRIQQQEERGSLLQCL